MLHLVALLATVTTNTNTGALCELEARLQAPAKKGVDAHAAWIADVGVDFLQAHRGDPCADSLAKLLLVVVTDHHRYAQKFRKLTDYEQALAFYDRVLVLPISADDHYRLSFFRAELLYDLGRWDLAHAGYNSVVKERPDGEYNFVCAYNSVLTAEHLVSCRPPTVFVKGVMSTASAPQSGTCAPKPALRHDELSAAEQALVQSCQTYIALADRLPSNDRKRMEELTSVIFKAAYVYSAHDRVEGVALFQDLMTRFPQTETAARGAGELLDLLWRIDRKKAVEQAEVIAAQPQWMADRATAAAVAAVRKESKKP